MDKAGAGMASGTNDRRPAALGALWMLGGVVSFTLMALAGRAAGRTHDTFEIMLYRSLVGLVILLVLCAATGRLGQIGRGRLGLMALRNLFHFAGQNLWLHALMVLPLAQLFALEFTTPVWVLLLSPLLLGEPITRRGALAALAGFAGILVVTRPFGALDAGLVAAALSAVGFAVSGTVTRLLTRTETVVSILFWLHAMQAVMALVLAGADGHIAPPGAESAGPLLAIGLLGLIAHAALTIALSLAPAQVVMPVDYLRLPLVILVGWWIYAEPADLWVIAGGALIVAANWINLPARRRKSPS